MKLREIFETCLIESGHVYIPDLDTLMLSDKDLAKIARLALREMNRYGNRKIKYNADLREGSFVLPADLGPVHSAEPLYGDRIYFNRKSRCLSSNRTGVAFVAVTLTTDWTISEVVDEQGVIVTDTQPQGTNYCEEHDLPPVDAPVYEILGYEESLHRELFDKIMCACFMIVLGRSRSNFALNDNIADTGGSELFSAGQQLLDETRATLIEVSDQFIGLLDLPEGT